MLYFIFVLKCLNFFPLKPKLNYNSPIKMNVIYLSQGTQRAFSFCYAADHFIVTLLTATCPWNDIK